MKKKLRVSAIGIMLLAGFVGFCAAQDWPQWRGANRDSRVTGFAVPDTWPSQLAQQWKIKVGYGDATPALADGKLYLFTRIDGNEVLQCLDASTGELIWKESYMADEVTGPAARHPGPRSTPTVVNGRVVIIGATGIISCLDAKSGKLLWRNSDYANMVPAYFTGMSPLVSGEHCYAHLGGVEGSAILAFNMTTGDIVWKYQGEGPAYASPDLMLFDKIKVVVMQTDKALIGLSADSGEPMWKISTPVERRYYNSSSPVIDGDKIYLTGQGLGSKAVTIAKRGSEFSVVDNWNNPAIGNTYNTPVLKDGYLYGLSDRGYLYCLDASDGTTAWADTTRHRDFGSVIDAGKVMLALSSSSDLVVFKPVHETYRQVALIPVAETPTYAHPVISGNRIYIKDEEYLILYSLD